MQLGSRPHINAARPRERGVIGDHAVSHETADPSVDINPARSVRAGVPNSVARDQGVGQRPAVEVNAARALERSRGVGVPQNLTPRNRHPGFDVKPAAGRARGVAAHTAGGRRASRHVDAAALIGADATRDQAIRHRTGVDVDAAAASAPCRIRGQPVRDGHIAEHGRGMVKQERARIPAPIDHNRRPVSAKSTHRRVGDDQHPGDRINAVRDPYRAAVLGGVGQIQGGLSVCGSRTPVLKRGEMPSIGRHKVLRRKPAGNPEGACRSQKGFAQPCDGRPQVQTGTHRPRSREPVPACRASAAVRRNIKRNRRFLSCRTVHSMTSSF